MHYLYAKVSLQALAPSSCSRQGGQIVLVDEPSSPSVTQTRQEHHWPGTRLVRYPRYMFQWSEFFLGQARSLRRWMAAVF